jgi:diguanylate cyclase (GGDEF)-like protein
MKERRLRLNHRPLSTLHPKTMQNPTVLILAQTAEKAKRWAEMLRSAVERIFLDAQEIPPEIRPEVVVTDSHLWSDADSGVLRVGSDGPADVVLPEGVTPRELQLTCRLLGEIVRLRRRERGIEESKRHWRNEALTDPLTGLPNRRAWEEELKERLDRLAAASTLAELASPSYSCHLCLAIFDLDLFKRVNDTHGHAAGDDVLKITGRTIRESLRPDDFVTRLGGDEFGLLFWLPNADCAPMVIERVRMAIPFQLERASVPVITASAGYCNLGYQDSPEMLASLVAMADEALRRAKESGRNQSIQER